MTWNRLNEIIKSGSNFLISSHVNPDGDSIGSQLAFKWYLCSIGKQAVIFNHDPVPRKLRFLENSNSITTVAPNEHFDVLVILDASNFDRLGFNGHPVKAPAVINIDHHEDNSAFGTVNVIDSRSSATGQIIYRFFSENGIDYPPSVAEALYTAILTDTGGFRFSNTNSAVLNACAVLAEKGARCLETYSKLYASETPAGMLLKSRIWSTLAFYCKNRICVMDMPMGLAAQIGADYGDSEGMADLTTNASTVEVGMLIKAGDSESHFSLRSTGRVDVGRVARGIPGGGGHNNAAGCTLFLKPAEARKQMLEIIETEIANIDRQNSLHR
jgi:phosphoesterase RecJ-like protein